MTIAAVFTLVAGLVVGWLAQRSRLCFVGGLRDWILVRDTALLKGVLAFALTAWIAFPIASRVAERVALPLPAMGGAQNGPSALAYTVASVEVAPSATAPANSAAPGIPLAVLLFLGGLGLGVFSVLAGGCPLRQHVLAGQGRGSALGYLAGFYAGALVFEAWILPLLGQIVK